MRRLAAVVALMLAGFLAACATESGTQRDICLAILPVIEPEGSFLTVTAIRPAPGTGPGVSFSYEARRPGHDQGLPESGFLTCRFAGQGAEAAAATLTDVETASGDWGEARIYFLNRFWLSDRAATNAAAAFVSLAPALQPHGLGTIDPALGYFLQQVLNAIPSMALYALLAVAYSLVYGLTNRINLAFGDMAMLGAFAALTGVGLALTAGLADVGAALGAGLAMAMLATGLWGAVIGRQIFAPLVARSSRALLVATLGLSLALQEFVARAQGVTDRWLTPMFNDTILVADGPFRVTVTPMQGLIAAGAAAACLGTLALMRGSRFGRAWRAVADDRTMAEMVGLDPRRVLVVTFVLAAGLAGAAGAILTLHYGGTNFHMGTILGLKALVAAVIGGIGSLPGAMVGGCLIGLVETLWAAYESIEWREAVVLGLLVVFLVLRPQGLMTERRALEERDGGA